MFIVYHLCFEVILLEGEKGQRTKKVNCLPEDTADSFLLRVWKYFEEGRTHGVQFATPMHQAIQEYALVVKGLAVYAAGAVCYCVAFFVQCSLLN
jgi:hypothetical protein